MSAEEHNWKSSGTIVPLGWSCVAWRLKKKSSCFLQTAYSSISDQKSYIICLYATGIATAVQCVKDNYRNDVGWIRKAEQYRL